MSTKSAMEMMAEVVYRDVRGLCNGGQPPKLVTCPPGGAAVLRSLDVKDHFERNDPKNPGKRLTLIKVEDVGEIAEDVKDDDGNVTRVVKRAAATSFGIVR